MDEIIHMIEDSPSEEIYQVPELQELPQDREPTEGRQYEPELSWDEKPDFALEVSIDQEEEYQPTYYFKRKAADPEVEPKARPQRTRKASERFGY